VKSQLAANNPKHIDKLLGAFHQVSKLIPRFEAHPPNSPRLQQTLKSMYSDIIIFCMNATLFYKHTTVSEYQLILYKVFINKA
jgi:hypothetical protein